MSLQDYLDKVICRILGIKEMCVVSQATKLFQSNSLVIFELETKSI